MTFKSRYAPKIPSYKYLAPPIKADFAITEGFLYSQEERAIHGNFFHKGIDYTCKYGTPVYAAASGYAVASYHRILVLNRDYTFRLYQNKPIGNGFGYFVQIFHPETLCQVSGGRITQYGHLSKVAGKINIKTTPPEPFDIIDKIKSYYDRRKENKISRYLLNKKLEQTGKIINKYPWTQVIYGFSFDLDLEKRESYLYTLEELKTLVRQGNKYVTRVEQGELIGYVGTSALIFGQSAYSEGTEDPDIEEFETWDKPHLHFEEAIRDPESRFKRQQRDPYGIYLSAKWYRDKNLRKGIFV